MNTKIIYLTGFMGAGKSTIGPILANTLGWNFKDLDKVIEEKTGRKITEIFEKDGEAFFRKIESDTLKELSEGKDVIVSLGGGTVINQKNLDLVKTTGKVIYLKASLDSVFKRLQYKRDRPVLKIDDDVENPDEKLIERLTFLMEKRKPYYEKAHLTIDTDEVSVGKTVDFIVKILNKEKHSENH